ncbi:TPA: hypothetical protein ACIPAM_004433 [Salmonella enterica subsp. enterica serovar Wangata]
MKKPIFLLSILIVSFSSVIEAKPLTTEQQHYIKKIIERQLLDPDSAKYKFPDYIESNPTYCFKLNATNSYGGYAGYRWVQISYKNIVQKNYNVVLDISVLPKEVFEESCNEIGYK